MCADRAEVCLVAFRAHEHDALRRAQIVHVGMIDPIVSLFPADELRFEVDEPHARKVVDSDLRDQFLSTRVGTFTSPPEMMQ